MSKQHKPSVEPASYMNWRLAISGTPTHEVIEYPLFSDAPVITGGIILDHGPYGLINTIRVEHRHYSRPALILRVADHREYALPSMDSTNTSNYHGGYLEDELAALVSLCMGIRLKAGGASRRFSPKGDPKGLPISHGHKEDPILPNKTRGWVVPRAMEQHSLDETNILGTYPNISLNASVALVRAARFYQEAMWIVESMPELSWLMLTSAIEVAAGYWKQERDTPLDQLKSSLNLGALVDLLEGTGQEGLVEQVAEIVAPYVGATKKYVDFMITFLPEPPQLRPPPAFQLSWDTNDMKKALGKIYDYRSKALHSGVPFPAPMSEPPDSTPDSPAVAETVVGLAASMKGAVWVKKDLPMFLHTYEYLVRKALLTWWGSLA